MTIAARERADSVWLVSQKPSETAPLRSFRASRGFGVHVTTAPSAVQTLASRSYGLVINLPRRRVSGEQALRCAVNHTVDPESGTPI